MKNWRRQIFPRDPKTLQEFHAQLSNPRNENLLKYNSTKMSIKMVQDSGGEQHLNIYDDSLVKEIFKDAQKVFVDGTFQCTPSVIGVYQLVTFMAICYGHVSLKNSRINFEKFFNQLITLNLL